jgi:hypothetical protein
LTYPQIINVFSRSEQGMTRPYLCGADDGQVYFVKGNYAGRRSLICEWLAGNLAMEFGLPIAPFNLLTASDDLLSIKNLGVGSLKDLGVGAVFGSARQECSEVTMTTAKLIDEKTKRDIAVFDWWVRNLDRSLSQNGGNPNLFWDNAASQVWVIDHNLAFDEAFNEVDFLETHIFSTEFQQVAADFFYQNHYVERLNAALRVWPMAVAELPKLWQTIDPEETIPSDFDLNMAYDTLSRCALKSFWNLS